MIRRLGLVSLIITVTCLGFAQGTKKANLTGTWNRAEVKDASGKSVTGMSEVMMITHYEPYIYLLYNVKDNMGERVLDLKGKTDGKPHEQKIDDRPATLIAQWEGENLILEIKREASFGFVHARRKMTFSNNGNLITTELAYLTKDGAIRSRGSEKWEKK